MGAVYILKNSTSLFFETKGIRDMDKSLFGSSPPKKTLRKTQYLTQSHSYAPDTTLPVTQTVNSLCLVRWSRSAGVRDYHLQHHHVVSGQRGDQRLYT